MKARFNPLIERAAIRLAGVDQYADIFERAALSRGWRGLLKRALRRRIAADVAAAPLLFIHVPKNGGTSIKRAVYESDPGHATIRYYELFAPALLARAESLAILRDPVDRFLSGFDFLLNRGGGDVSIRPEPLARMAQIATIDGFLDYLESVRGDWLKVDTFARPQSWYVADHRGAIRIRHFFLLEQSSGALSAFLAARGARPVPHVNRTMREQRVLSPAQRARVERLYAEDFALYAAVAAGGGYAGALAGVPLSALSRASTMPSIAA